MAFFELLKELCDIPGVSGNEHHVRNFILQRLSLFQPIVDSLGNIYVYIPALEQNNSTKTILINSHMDEVGFIISHIDEKTGKIYVYQLGRPQISGVIGEEVLIQTHTKKQIIGIITNKSINDYNEEENSKAVKLEDIYIDTGYSYNELMELGLTIGSFVNFNRKTKILDSNMIIGKAIDDRFGCYLMLEMLSGHEYRAKISPNNLLFLFSVREELLQKGTLNSINQWHIDLIITLDTVNAIEHYDDKKPNANLLFMNSGPLIVVQNRAGLTNPQLNQFIKDLAKRSNIPLQIGLQPFGDTDVNRIQYMLPNSVPAAILSIAVRNVHTPFSIASLHDIAHLSHLLDEIVAIKL